jgi:hypothetical protein
MNEVRKFEFIILLFSELHELKQDEFRSLNALRIDSKI